MLNNPIKGKDIKVIDFSDMYPWDIREKMNKWLQGEGKNADVLDIVYHFKIEPDYSISSAVTGPVWAILTYAIPEPEVSPYKAVN